MEQPTISDSNEWTLIETKELRDLHSRGKTIRDISCKLRRPDAEIISQLIILGIYGKPVDITKSKEPIAIPKYLPDLPKEPDTIMVPAKIKHKYDIGKKPASSFVDEDEMMRKDHDLRAEQTQLLKEVVSSLQHQTLLEKDIITAINKNTISLIETKQSLEKLIIYIEDATAGRLLKKKMEQEQAIPQIIEVKKEEKVIQSTFVETNEKKNLTKVCSRCNTERDISEFSKHSANTDGLQSFCKECMKEYHNKYVRPLKQNYKGIPITNDMINFVMALEKEPSSIYEKAKKFAKKYHIRTSAQSFRSLYCKIKKQH